MDCMPPWLSFTNQCYKNITTYKHTKKEISDKIGKKFKFPKYDSRPTEAETNCNDNPCKKMTNRISMTSDRMGNGLNSAYLKFRFKKTVRVEKKVIVYTWFNFIIDVGSSLGLWLGLSALGITDLAIEAFMVAKKWLKVK